MAEYVYTNEANKSVADTIDDSLGSTMEASKLVATTINESLGVTMEAPKSVASTIYESLGGTKETPKKSTEKPLNTMLTTINTNLGNKAQKIKPEVDVEPIAGASKNEDANLSAQTQQKKRNRIQENEDSSNKKLKTQAKEEVLDGIQLKYVQGLVNQKMQGMPKPVVDPQFLENARAEIEAMSRREVNDLVIHKMVEEKKAKCEFQYMRTQFLNTENTLATYRRKIAKMSQTFFELDAIGKKTSRFPLFSAGQNVALKSEPHAAGMPQKLFEFNNMRTTRSDISRFSTGQSLTVPLLPPPNIPTMARPNEPKPVFRKRLYAMNSESALAAISSIAKIATPEAKLAKASADPGQDANDSLKETTQQK